MKQYLLIVSILGVILLPIHNSLAAAASFPQDTTMTLNVGGTSYNFTINRGSSADSVVVNGSSFVVTISSGERFIISSTNFLKFTNDSGYPSTCSNLTSGLDITGPATQQIITVTPDGSTCSAPSGGGGDNTGSGGGGGGGNTAAWSTPTPTPYPAPSTTSQPVTSTPVTPSANTTSTQYSLTRDLTVNSKGADVTALQDFLRAKGYFTTSSNGIFGPATKNAVIAWQKANGISPASGYFGRLSRAIYNKSSSSSSSSSPKVKINGDVSSLNVRQNPTTSSTVVSKVLPNQEFTILDSKNGWYNIQLNALISGWVLGKYANQITN